MNPENGTTRSGTTSGGTMLRMLGAQQKREVKATQNLSIIVLFFMICWIPLYTINCVMAFCPTCVITTKFMNPFIILSHLNSACNPLLYAYHLKDFRAAMKHLLFNIFGIKYAVPSNYNGRPSIASNNVLSYSGKLAKESRFRSSITTQMSTHNRYQSHDNMDKSTMLAMPSRISSLVPKSVTLAAVAASAGGPNKNLWKLSEIPSLSGDSDYDNREISLKEPDSSEQSLRAAINCESRDCSNFDIASDDVSLDDMCPIAHKHMESDAVSDNVPRISEKPVISSAFNRKFQDCLSSSSPQLSRNVFVVETDLTKFDGPARIRQKFGRSFSEVEREAKPNKKAAKFSMSGDFIYSPSKRSVKSSPFKDANAHLLNKHLDSSSEDSASLKSSKERSTGSIYNFDNQSFSS